MEKKESECVFCRIANKSLPAAIVYEDASVVAFLDITPVSHGHVLVVPKEHSRNIFDISDESLSAAMAAAKKIARAAMEAVGAGGINIHINNEPPAGQKVFHTHIHIIPRFSDDRLAMWEGKPYERGEAERIAEKVRSAL